MAWHRSYFIVKRTLASLLLDPPPPNPIKNLKMHFNNNFKSYAMNENVLKLRKAILKNKCQVQDLPPISI